MFALLIPGKLIPFGMSQKLKDIHCYTTVLWQKAVSEYWSWTGLASGICTYFLLSDNGSVVVFVSYTSSYILSSEICSHLPFSDKRQ